MKFLTAIGMSGVFIILAGCATFIPSQTIQPEVTPQAEEDIVEKVSVGEQQSIAIFSESPTRTPFQPLTQTPVIEPTATSTEIPTATPTLEPTYPPVPEVSNTDAERRIPVRPGAPKPAPNFSEQIEGKTFNILLAGTDQVGRDSFRTDTLLIVSIRPVEKTVSVISIPRDLYVYIPAYGMHKINTAYIWGQTKKYPGKGIASLKDTIQYNLGVRIDRYVLVNFDGFRKIVNILDGIDVAVVCPYSEKPLSNLGRNLPYSKATGMYTVGPGLVHMDGKVALWYARTRLNSSDYDRGRRQQEVIRALYNRAMQLNVITRVPELYKEIIENVRTDVELQDVLSLVPMAFDFNPSKIRSYFISAGMVKPTNINGMYAQLPKTEKIYNLIQKALSPPSQKHVVRSNTKIEVCNASGNSDWDDLSAERLHYAGYQTTACTIEINDVQKQSVVQDLHSGMNQEMGVSLLGTLGLPGDRLETIEDSQNQALLRVILGKDYNPCFSPYTITR
jgi:polyisoprenyl-teichoic acid--peptidoglycan teichoic acid transferase